MQSPETIEVVYFPHRSDWREWLHLNFRYKKEVWFVFPHKHAGLKAVSYNDAVEEALCFGWIDSTVRKLDDFRKIQRFTPRRPKSTYSQPNIERLKWLLEHNMVHPHIVTSALAVVDKPFHYPADILEAIKQLPEAWAHYQRFSEGYKRIRIAYIEDARPRPEEFLRRLNNFIAKTLAGKRIAGYGGIDKYY
ncbi:MAG: YdeI/OmpD-associated family protein [Rhodothermia bacterium]|nr:YdeI/OmpD-associated family protein [Rhodothermia bacterium]